MDPSLPSVTLVRCRPTKKLPGIEDDAVSALLPRLASQLRLLDLAGTGITDKALNALYGRAQVRVAVCRWEDSGSRMLMSPCQHFLKFRAPCRSASEGSDKSSSALLSFHLLRAIACSNRVAGASLPYAGASSSLAPSHPEFNLGQEAAKGAQSRRAVWLVWSALERFAQKPSA
jgi:hypothetical protein